MSAHQLKTLDDAYTHITTVFSLALTFVGVLVGSKPQTDALVRRLTVASQGKHLGQVFTYGAHEAPKLNQHRDTLVQEGFIVLVRCDTQDEAAAFLRATPDFSDWLDSIIILDEERVEDEVLDTEHRRYLHRLIEQNQSLDLTGILPGFNQEWRLQLNDVYLDLLDRPEAPYGKARDIPKGILIAGRPGTGKTTYVRHETLSCAQRCLEGDRNAPTPIVIPAVQYAEARDRRQRSLKEYIREHLKESGVAHARGLLHKLGARVTVFIDALDEVATDESIRTIAAQIVELSEQTSYTIVVTCRPSITPLIERLFKKFRIQSLRSLNAKEAERLIHTLVNAHQHTTGSHASPTDDLLSRLAQSPELRALTQTPLTLTFLTLLSIVEGRLPDRRVTLYHRLAQLLVERWNTARSLAGPRRSLPYGEALRTFAPLAWWVLHHHPSGRVHEDLLVDRLIQQLTARGEPEASAMAQTKAFLDRLRRDTLLLIPEGSVWTFFHPTVVEYLAGVEVARNHTLRRRLYEDKRLYDPNLRETVLFAAGEMGVIRADDENLAELVEQLLKTSKRAGRYDASYSSMLTGLLLEEVGLARTQRHQTLERLCELWFDYTYNAWSRRQTLDDLLRVVSVLDDGGKNIVKQHFERFISDPGSIPYIVVRELTPPPSDVDEISFEQFRDLLVALVVQCIRPLMLVRERLGSKADRALLYNLSRANNPTMRGLVWMTLPVMYGHPLLEDLQTVWEELAPVGARETHPKVKELYQLASQHMQDSWADQTETQHITGSKTQAVKHPLETPP